MLGQDLLDVLAISARKNSFQRHSVLDKSIAHPAFLSQVLGLAKVRFVILGQGLVGKLGFRQGPRHALSQLSGTGLR